MALTAERNTPQKADIQRSPLFFGVKATTQIWKGGLCGLNAGVLVPMSTATGLVAVGRAKKSMLGLAADGLVGIETEEGIFKWANSGGDLVVVADVGANVYAVDDFTVCHTGTGKSVAGKCIGIDSDGVWVRSTV